MSQVTSAHRGLDRCAALLRNLLSPEKDGKQPSLGCIVYSLMLYLVQSVGTELCQSYSLSSNLQHKHINIWKRGKGVTFLLKGRMR